MGEMDMNLEKALKIKNSTIAGYLFGKIQEIEKAGVRVRYKVELDSKLPVPEITLIEALGLLFDHAMVQMAGAELPTKKIYFSLKQKESIVTIKFANASEFLEVDDMAAIWEKGSRNNLYQLRKLAKDNGGSIYVQMKTVDEVDYLCMKVILPCKLLKMK